jgi:hypothetical protein
MGCGSSMAGRKAVPLLSTGVLLMKGTVVIVVVEAGAVTAGGGAVEAIRSRSIRCCPCYMYKLII